MSNVQKTDNGDTMKRIANFLFEAGMLKRTRSIGNLSLTAPDDADRDRKDSLT